MFESLNDTKNNNIIYFFYFTRYLAMQSSPLWKSSLFHCILTGALYEPILGLGSIVEAKLCYPKNISVLSTVQISTV